MGSPETTRNSFFLKVLSSDNTIFEGDVIAVSSRNETANFDVLAQHTNFITIVTEFVDIHTAQNEKIHLNIEYGILQCESNKVTVFLGIKKLVETAS